MRNRTAHLWISSKYAILKNNVMVGMCVVLVVCSLSAHSPSALQAQTSATRRQTTEQSQTSGAKFSAPLASSDNERNDSSRQGRIGIVGLVKEGENLRGRVRFKPMGSDAWVDIPSEIIDKRDHLDRFVSAGQPYEQVRLRLVAPQDRLQRLFGVSGWTEIKDHTTLEGVVVSNDYSGGIFGDGDWLLKIRPDPAFNRLLFNRAGRKNADGLVECEIEPLDALGNEDNAREFFGRVTGKRVRIVGTWVEDQSHDDKTEIHPITSIACLDGEFVHLFAFSDDSDNFPAQVPHSKENRVAYFSVPINPAFTTFSISQEEPYVRSRSVGVTVDASGNRVVVGTVQSGTSDEGKGFYYAKLKLERCPPHGCEQPVPPRGHYLEVQFFDGTDAAGGSMFLQNANGSFRERPLGANLSKEQLAQVAASLAGELGMRYVLRGDTIKLYAPSPWPRIVCSPGVFNFSDGED